MEKDDDCRSDDPQHGSVVHNPLVERVPGLTPICITSQSSATNLPEIDAYQYDDIDVNSQLCIFHLKNSMKIVDVRLDINMKRLFAHHDKNTLRSAD